MITFNIVIFPIFILAAVKADLMMDRVKRQNVPIERHYVTTIDGYILKLYHIPPIEARIENGTNVVFLMHGLFSASPSYVLYPNDSYGYYFHNRGYDVWLGNGRGTTYSRNHTTLDPEDTEFWKFSWHEIGAIDVPAMIDYTLNYTKQDKLIYIGHSQGATTIAVTLSERPEYNEKISSIHLLAPPVISKETTATMLLLAHNIDRVADFVESNEIFEVLSAEDSSRMMKSLGVICADPSFTAVCKRVIEFSAGPFSRNGYFNNLVSDVAAAGLPAGASVRKAIHYFQCFSSGRFQKYDYGFDENLKRYGAEYPPKYNLTNIATKVHVMDGSNDYIVLESNTAYLIKNLKNAKQLRKDRMANFNHFDFMLRPQVKRVVKIVHKRMLQFEKD